MFCQLTPTTWDAWAWELRATQRREAARMGAGNGRPALPGPWNLGSARRSHPGAASGAQPGGRCEAAQAQAARVPDRRPGANNARGLRRAPRRRPPPPHTRLHGLPDAALWGRGLHPSRAQFAPLLRGWLVSGPSERGALPGLSAVARPPSALGGGSLTGCTRHRQPQEAGLSLHVSVTTQPSYRIGFPDGAQD